MYNMEEIIEREKHMKRHNISYQLISLLLITFVCCTFLYAGDASRVGTASGVQVQVPVGARAIGMGGADLAYVSSLDAIYWNPAGLGRMEERAAAMFTTQNIIADINVNYFAVGFNAGRLGVLGVSLKSFSFGDIPITTVEAMDGTGATYSPTFATGGLSYSKLLTDRIGFGVNAKVVYESVPRASATAFAVDIGIQYQQLLTIEGLSLGMVIKNIGTNMHYTGSAFLEKATDLGETYSAYRYRPTSSDQLPSTLEMGLTYKLNLGVGDLLVAGQFQNNNFEQDQLKVGAEFGIKNLLYLRGGYHFLVKDPDNPDYGETVYSIALGGGMKYSIGGSKLFLDYAYQPMEYFGNGNVFSIGIAF